MPATKKITLIVTTRGPEPLLPMTLNQAADSAGKDIKIIVVCDGEPTRTDIDGLCDEVIVTDKPCGPARCRHEGMLRVQSGVAVFADAHVAFSQDWAVKLAEYYAGGTGRANKNAKHLLCFPTSGLDTDGKPIESGPMSQFRCGAKPVWTQTPDTSFKSPVLGYDLQNTEYIPGQSVGYVMGGCYTLTPRLYRLAGRPWGVCTAWGQAEAYLSLGVWLAGGECKCFSGIRMWHCYKTPWAPKADPEAVFLNAIRLVHLLPLSDGERSELLAACKAVPEQALQQDLARGVCRTLKKHWYGLEDRWPEVKGKVFGKGLCTQPASVSATDLAKITDHLQRGVAIKMRQPPPAPIPTLPKRQRICPSCDAWDSLGVTKKQRLQSGLALRRYQCNRCGRTAVSHDGGVLRPDAEDNF